MPSTALVVALSFGKASRSRLRIVRFNHPVAAVLASGAGAVLDLSLEHVRHLVLVLAEFLH
jgi:hypothetical protein